jgi:hypothetical protein
MPMVMPYEPAWEKLIAERVDTRRDLAVVTKADIESVTGNELRLMAKMDSSADVPAALRRHGYFLLPIKNGEYLLVRGNGFHTLESLPEPPTVYRPHLDFDLMTLSVGDSEMQHLDYSRFESKPVCRSKWIPVAKDARTSCSLRAKAVSQQTSSCDSCSSRIESGGTRFHKSESARGSFAPMNLPDGGFIGSGNILLSMTSSINRSPCTEARHSSLSRTANG